MHRASLLALSLLGGCFHVSHFPVCEEVSRTEIGMDEETVAGTPNALLAAVAMDTTFGGHYVADDAPVDVEVWVEQDGPPLFVEQQSGVEKSRSFGFGKSYPAIHVICPDQIELPLAAEARTVDGVVDVFAEGVALMSDPDEHWSPGVPDVLLTGSYADATVPATEHDPAEWDDKYAYIDLGFDEDGFREGSVGWGGEQETEDYASAMVDAAVRFGPELLPSDEGTPTP